MAARHVFVSGASGGIGLSICEYFLREDAQCVVSAHYNSTQQSIRPLLEHYGDRIAAVQADLTKEKEVARALRDAVERFGTVHCMVLNHAIFPSQNVPLVDMDVERIDEVLRVNLVSVMLLAKHWMRGIRSSSSSSNASDNGGDETGFAAVLIGSTAGRFGEKGHSAYAAAKGAMQTGLLLSLKNELPQLHPRARINCVAPGWTATPMAQEAIARGEHHKALRTTPLRKIAQPSDVAATVYFLCSKGAAHITGECIMVAGGMEGRVLNE